MTSRLAIRVVSLAVCAIAGAGAAGPVAAQSASPAQALLDQSVVVNLGAFVMQTDMKAALNGQSVQNPDIDFDQTFGKAKDTTRIRGDALWRISPKHHVALMYFDNGISRTKTIDRDVHWGDAVYPVGATVTSESKFKVGALSYEYAFMRDPGYEVAVDIGLHVSQTKLSLAGDAVVNGVARSGQVQSNSVTAPLPVIGLRGAWAVTPNLVLDAQGQYFKVNANGIGGSWSDLRANATWMFNKTFGLGLGYDRFYTHLDVNKSGFDGRAKVGYSGLQVYGTLAF
jgi:hypothetical protein